mgnify:CR=1 FL=1
MKQSLLITLVILIAGQLCLIGLPWWAIAPIGALAGWLFPQMPAKSFSAGFAAGYLLWLLHALWLDMGNEGILSGRIGSLFMGLSTAQLLQITGLLGGLLAGFGCLTGRLARDLVVRNYSVN